VSNLEQLLPITAIVAIGIFVLKEAVEAWKRHQADRRKIKAARYLLARECEQNLWVIRSLHDALTNAGEVISEGRPDDFRIIKRESGAKNWVKTYENGDLSRGGMLYPVKRIIIDSMGQTIAELDPRLFRELEGGIDAVNELNHLHDSLVNYVMDADEREKSFFDGFVVYALKELHDIYRGIDKLYRACTGKRLTKFRLR
jgi:hypothetical protein